MRFRSHLLLLSIFLITSGLAHAEPPSDFREAKQFVRQIYGDNSETFYCGCKINWTRGSSGRPDLESCGYQIRRNEERASRIEWEHIVPAWNLGRQRPCWRKGGRSECRANDPVYNAMAGDLRNLVPSIGEVNADRSNFQFTMLSNPSAQHGACPFYVDFSQRAVQPREAVRGMIARVYFYMHDRYGLRMSRQQEQLMIAWHRMYPVTDEERERDRRVAKYMGHTNPFVTGEQVWELGRQPKAKGLAALESQHITAPNKLETSGNSNSIRGNKNSKIYHRPGCPSYDAMSPYNIVDFATDKDAVAAGYRLARNC